MDHTPHIAILPSPGMGHLIPLAAFAEELHHRHHVSATIIVPTTGPPPQAQLQVVQSLPKGINYLFLPPVSFDNKDAESRIISTIKLSLPFLRDALRSLLATKRLVALVADPFGVDAFDVANEFQVSPYLFFPASAMSLSFCLYLPKLDEIVSGEYRDMLELVRIPGCIPVQGSDLMTPVQERTKESYKWFLNHVKQYNLAEGILLNSFMELEKGAIEALNKYAKEESGIRAIYPIGPLIQTRSGNGLERSECLQWLDNQPSGSVIFISFGSGGTLSYNQLNELALGLEMSGQRFLWVLKSPNDASSNAAFFSAQSQDNPLSFLPKGFLDRTKGQGFVVPSWAPQIEVLAHGSTGGFLTHCGWNSTLESVVNGIPLIAWPLYAEQKMNAVMLTEGLNIALRPRVDTNGLVGREEIANVAKELMEGEEGKNIRNKINKLKDAATKVLSKDGSSTKSLSNFVIKLKNPKGI
ncbi:hypothetical protein LguiA_019272 [Lonicera macranthoides]